MLELDPGCLDVIREGVVQTLPLFPKIEALEHFEPADLMESNDTTLVKRDQELTTGA